ncbi:alkaline phosphatase family protein [Chitinophaga defluvii]|uniref:Alkaline phosphatase family protein n=1 Tax=Chitinophaga defluvii TaxID=3163343 RepID=A0ABV2T5V8_9BACT
MNKTIPVKGWQLPLFALVTVLLLSYCNKPVSFYEELGADSVSVNLTRKKVLLINIQGAQGNTVRDANTPNIKGLLSNSIYSWDAVCDTVSTDHVGWAELLTGVRGKKNGITDGSYIDNRLVEYPSFLSRLTAANDKLKLISISSVATLNDTIIPAASASVIVKAATDAAAKDTAINRLKNDQADVVMVSLREVNEAGKQHGFSPASTAYMSAIEAADQHIGEILAALKGRENYAKEDWMVIITSNHGGTAAGTYGGNSFNERNTFLVFYNNRFVSKEITMPLVNVPYAGKYPFFYRADNKDHAAYTNNPAFHFGSDVSFTVEFNIHTTGSQQDNPIVTNKNWNSGGNTGWIIFIANGNIRLNYKGASTGRLDMGNGPPVADGKWHRVTVVFDRQKEIAMYKDGEFFVSGPNIKDKGNVDAGLPLTVGTHAILNYDYYGPNDGSLNSYVADIRIWKTVLSPETIQSWAFRSVTQAHPDYASLIGYWKASNGDDGDVVLKDDSPTKADLTIQHGLRWDYIDEVLNPSSIDATAFVPQSVDLPANVLAWMGLKLQPSWQLDGRILILQ